MSLRLIKAVRSDKNGGIIDVGGGASSLVDFLLDGGYSNVAVLDLSGVALGIAKQRLGSRADSVAWFEADITKFTPPRRYGIWHDRAVFHFLTDAADRRKYVQTLMRALAPDGHVIIATFAKDGPLKCSGLDICRYDAPAIRAELGPDFKFTEQADEIHVTPWNTEQKFSYFQFVSQAAEQ